MDNLKFGLAVFVAVAAIVLAATNFFSSNWLAALMYILWAVCLFFTIGGFDEIGVFKLACILPTLIGFLLIFKAYPSTALSDARMSAYTSFQNLSADVSKCNREYSQIKTVEELGLKACSAQGWIDLTGMMSKAVDAIYLPPPVGVMKDLSQINDRKSVDSCARIFVTAEQLCPNAYTGFDLNSRNVLYRAAQQKED
jgi:membrane-bound ClpP family serine protease